MEKITFYHNPMSRGRVIHRMLEEVGAAYEVKILDFKKNEHKSPDYLKINPMGKIPAIVHNGIVITETAAICVYLADAFPKAELAPALSDPSRGTYLRWIFFTLGCVEAALTDKSFPRTGEPRPGMLGYGTYEDTIRTLEGALKPGPFILGNTFSAADVYISAQIGWSIFTKTLEPKPVFTDYLARCADRPAAKRVDEQSVAFDKALAVRN